MYKSNPFPERMVCECGQDLILSRKDGKRTNVGFLRSLVEKKRSNVDFYSTLDRFWFDKEEFPLLHLVHQRSAFHNVFVGDVVLGVWLAVQRDAFYIFMFFRQAFGYDGECLAIGQVERDAR